MKIKVSDTLRMIFVSIVAVSFLGITLVDHAQACGTLPEWDKDGDFFVSGKVGIGIRVRTGIGLGETLHIRNADPSVMIDFSDTPTNDKAELIFSNNGNPGARLYWSRIDDKIYLQNLIPAGGGPVLVMDNAGYVGIGTATPSTLLHVAGNATVDGNIAAKYQDVAEWVKTPKPLSAGTVVMIDPENTNQVIPSEQAYSTLVAGVVTETPGIILGEEGKDKTKISHTGRVKVKVDTNYGEIKAGDLLVASHTQGYAMKADLNNLKPGMLLGKALEPLKEGQRDEILVLITLQ